MKTEFHHPHTLPKSHPVGYRLDPKSTSVAVGWTLFQQFGLAMVVAFIVLILLFVIDPLVLSTPGQLLALHRICGLLVATGTMVISLIIFRKEQELELLRDELQIQLGRANSALASCHQQVKDLDPLKIALVQQREDFVLALQLRLKTPVQANRVTIEHLIDGEYGPLSDIQREILKLLIENNQEIDRLVSMLVSLYRYRNGKVLLRNGSCHIAALLQQVSSTLVDKAATRNIHVIFDYPPPALVITCDQAELQKLLNHLFDNAIKYARTEVLLKSELRESSFEISVEDDGPGIAPEDIEALFDHFYYVSKSGEYASTTGVGLCLCAEIARAHGGSISCDRSPSNGARFVVVLPFTEARTT